MFSKPKTQDILPSNLNINSLQKWVIELDECNEQSLLGGSFTGEDRLHTRLKSSDTQTTTSGSYYGIRSIPTLMV